jgi:hypothetical protein
VLSVAAGALMDAFCFIKAKLMMLSGRLAEIIMNWDSSVSVVLGLGIGY